MHWSEKRGKQNQKENAKSAKRYQVYCICKKKAQGPKDAIFDPKRAILTPMANINPALLFSNSIWDIGTQKY